MNRSSFNRIFFQDKKIYNQLDNDTKRDYSFMFNRCMARLMPVNCDALNSKSIDSALSMDIWSIFSKNLLKEPRGFEPEWRKYKKTKSLLDGFTKEEREMFTNYFNTEIEEVVEDQKKEKNIGKIEKNNIKKKK